VLADTENTKPEVHSRHTYNLRGCNPRPLASYLKALGVFRLITEQKDPEARGYWDNDSFCLVTKLTLEELCEFFLSEWKPTPFVSPWNKASGFFSKTDKALVPVELSTAPRFEPLRRAIKEARNLTAEMEEAVLELKSINDESNKIRDKTQKEALRNSPEYKSRLSAANRKCKKLKDELLPECQRRWRSGALTWLRAAAVVNADGQVKFPALLGTGGNDGKLDFTNNAYQRLGNLFELGSSGEARPGVSALLEGALFGTPTLGCLDGAIGQYAPASGGGANGTTGALAPSQLNPWDLLLLLEGSVIFSSGSTRRLLGKAAPQAAAPFSVRTQTSGYGSASAADDGVRGEQWFPIWERPWRISELKSALLEGRAQIGKKPAETGGDLAKAVARLGTARGIDSFERYGYLERNGNANYAVPLGRWHVQDKPQTRLLDELDDWTAKIRYASKDKNAPANLRRASRAYDQAEMTVLTHDTNESWKTLLISAALLESQLVTSASYTAKKKLNPIPCLHQAKEWIEACGNDREVRLALCLAGVGTPTTKPQAPTVFKKSDNGITREPLQKNWGQFGKPANTVRRHWLPIDSKGRFVFSESNTSRDPEVVVSGRDPKRDLIAIIERRLAFAETGASRRLPLLARAGLEASPADLEELLENRVDLSRVLWLARAFAALNWNNLDWKMLLARQAAPKKTELPLDYQAFRIAYLPYWSIVSQKENARRPASGGAERMIPADASALRQLTTGNVNLAFQQILRRLKASGIHPPFSTSACTAVRAQLYAVSLAFPISEFQAGKFLTNCLRA
jgi:CRISPR-associated protein Csx17